MKRLILTVAMMSVTFGLGIGVHRLTWRDNAPPINVAPLQGQTELVAPVAPISRAHAATPEPILVLDYDPEKLTPWAVFHAMGHKPKEFVDIDSLELGLYRDVDNQGGYMALVTCDTGANCDSVPSTFVLVTEQRLFFATSPIPNIEFEYRFDGKFLRTDFNAVAGKQIAVLRGTLVKTKNGRKIAEHTFNFRMEPLGC